MNVGHPKRHNVGVVKVEVDNKWATNEKRAMQCGRKDLTSDQRMGRKGVQEDEVRSKP